MVFLGSKVVSVRQSLHVLTCGMAGDRDNSVHTGSVGISSGPWLRVQVRVGTEMLPTWHSGLAKDPNCQLGYNSIVIYQSVWIRPVVSRLSSGFISKYIQSTCLWDLIQVLEQNRSFNNQQSIIQDATPKIVDALLNLNWGVVTSTLYILPISAGITSSKEKCGSIALGS